MNMETTQLVITITAVILTAVFGPLGGALLATGVGIWWQKQQEKETQKAQNQAVRFLIGLEVDKNLTAFWHFWQSVCDATEEIDVETSLNADLSTVQQLHLLKEFVELPLPEWHYRVLESQLPMVPRAFSNEIEKIRQVFDLRADLDSVTDIHTAVSNLWSARPAGVRMIPVIGLSSDHTVGNKADNREMKLLEDNMLKSWQTLKPALKQLQQRRQVFSNQ